VTCAKMTITIFSWIKNTTNDILAKGEKKPHDKKSLIKPVKKTHQTCAVASFIS